MTDATTVRFPERSVGVIVAIVSFVLGVLLGVYLSEQRIDARLIGLVVSASEETSRVTEIARQWQQRALALEQQKDDNE